MHRVRSLFLKVTVASAVVLGVAACDASSGSLGPREHRPEAPASRSAADTMGTRKLGPTSTTSLTVDEETCRSGYQVAYREDGTPYCAPIE
jgi:hypothetical protein